MRVFITGVGFRKTDQGRLKADHSNPECHSLCDQGSLCRVTSGSQEDQRKVCISEMALLSQESPC